MANINDFKARLRGGGARANQFKVTLPFPGYSAVGGETADLAFLCTATSIPGMTLSTVQVPFRGRVLNLVGDRTFGAWSMTVLNDTDFKIYRGLERWMNGMNSHQENLGLFVDNAGYNTYATNVEVKQLNQIGSTVKTYSLKNAFPSALSQIELSYDQATQIEEFTVTFQYDYWSNDNTL
jgi:hypothetical protein